MRTDILGRTFNEVLSATPAASMMKSQTINCEFSLLGLTFIYIGYIVITGARTSIAQIVHLLARVVFM